MAIVHHLDRDGGFTVGDTETRRTSYAYPTSPHANMARGMPERVAAEMMKGANAAPDTPIYRDYDSRNWEKLSAL